MAESGGTVNIPVVGKQPKKLVVGGLLVVGTAVVIYYARSRKAAAPAAAAASTPADQYPADGTSGNPSDLYSTDPATGQTYGNELAGSGGTLGAFGSGAASGQYYDPATGAYDLTAPYGTQPVTQPFQTQGGPPFSTNAAWTDWVIQELAAQNTSIDTGALTDALGVYLNGQSATAAQQTLIFDALAIGGDPPVAGANGFPPKVQAVHSSGPGVSGTAQVPSLKGKTAAAAAAALTTLGLVAHNGGGNAATGTVNSQTPGAGATVAEGSAVDLGFSAGAAGGTPAGQVTIPVTFGESASSAISKIQGAGLTVSTSPVRNPKSTYVSTGSSPEGGRQVARGSHVVLNVKVS
jgi:PASTA domain